VLIVEVFVIVLAAVALAAAAVALSRTPGEMYGGTQRCKVHTSSWHKARSDAPHAVQHLVLRPARLLAATPKRGARMLHQVCWRLRQLSRWSCVLWQCLQPGGVVNVVLGIQDALDARVIVIAGRQRRCRVV
jgi:hypothetical protein